MRRSISRRREFKYGETGRVAFANANGTLPRFRKFVDQAFRPDVLRSIEDRRTWHPEGVFRPARSFSVPRHRLSVIGPRLRSQTPYKAFSTFDPTPVGIGFRSPARVLVCVRRKIRREVLHARGVAGSKGIRKRRISEFTSVSCR